jgi:TPR repeat protein
MVAAIAGAASMAAGGVIGGTTFETLNNLTGDAFKNAFRPPDQRQPSPPSAKPQPESFAPSLPDAGRLTSAFPGINPSSGCLLAGCKPIDFSKLANLSSPALTPPSPTIGPPPVPTCEGSSLDGLEALRRAAILDSGTSFAPRNAAAARACYYVAAQQNIPVAQFSLADMRLNGDVGVPRDPDRGLEYLEAAARNGFVPAQIRLGDAYDRGEGTPPNPSAAFKWFAVAANAGSTYAQYQLSRFFYGRKDYVGAFVWLNAALIGRYQPALATMQELLDLVYADARAGIAGAQFIVGAASEFGVPGVVSPDPRLAFLAYRDAQRGNWSAASSALQRVCFNFPAACF